MNPSQYTRIVLNERPQKFIDSNTFRQETVPFDLKPGQGQVLVKVTWLSLDPTMRGWLNDTRSYLPPVQIGETMRAGGLGTVIEVGPGSQLKESDTVFGMLGWREYAVVDEKAVRKIIVPPGSQELDFLGPLGITGMTAYFGLNDVGKLKAGETLVVSGAAGAVGSIVCQMGKKQGAKVVAIAGSDEKCQWLEKELGVDKAINYKSPTFRKDFIDAVGYLDVYFDNVGGDILNLALTRLNKGARIAFCGAISDYNSGADENIKGLTAYMNLISQRAKLEGFIVLDYAEKFPEAIKEVAGWLADGSLKRKFHVVHGLDKAPSALPMLFTGENIGKLVIHVSGPDAKL
ncbi:hypothetical protein EWM64_g6351 [Hericium alpestre]|uniref:Enoyl reductase (ER) domain-containing protein n=1 Tax=Hericium alpestre TaxID=135208 RepID=A0A4Y9ZUX7_9AGAM|nr:hypothetical protein EWM64_g6351 [Hericium alpestre]